jgi:hypothetical protein
MDFIFWAMFLLEGLQPWDEIRPLLPVSCGYRGHDYESGYSRYALSLETQFNWESGKPLEGTARETIPLVYETVDLKLWTPYSGTLTSIDLKA